MEHLVFVLPLEQSSDLFLAQVKTELLQAFGIVLHVVLQARLIVHIGLALELLQELAESLLVLLVEVGRLGGALLVLPRVGGERGRLERRGEGSGALGSDATKGEHAD